MSEPVSLYKYGSSGFEMSCQLKKSQFVFCLMSNQLKRTMFSVMHSPTFWYSSVYANNRQCEWGMHDIRVSVFILK